MKDDFQKMLHALLHTEPTHSAERAEALVSEFNPEDRANGFRLLAASRPQMNASHEDVDGDYRRWNDLTPAGKLGVIAADAAFYQSTFEAFAPVALEFVGADVLLDAALTVASSPTASSSRSTVQLPDDGRVDPGPLAERVKDLVRNLKQAERQNDHTPER